MTEVDVPSSPIGISGRLRIRAWSVPDIERADPGWSERPREQRHALLRRPSTFPSSPIHDIETQNLAVNGFLEELARGLAPNTDAETKATHLAIGDDDTAPDGANESLNNEIYRTIVGDADPDGRDLITSTFISQNEMNGDAIREIGLTTGPVSGSWRLLTHAALAAADQIDEKTSDMTVTIDYVIEIRRVS